MSDTSLVIGWDGAPFNTLSEWVTEGKLPNLQKLSEDGYFGPLETTPYIMSPCAWSTFLTGQNAGSHGVYDFYSNNFREGKYFREPIDARVRDASEFWEVFNEQDKSVGLINVPVTYPASEIDDFMISGVLSPSTDDDRFVHPPDFLDDFESLDDYLIDLDMSKNDDRDVFVANLERMVEMRAELINYCIEEAEDLDVLMAVFTSPDRLSHYFWHFESESHPYRGAESDEQMAEYEGILFDLFQTLDAKLGDISQKFQNKYGDDANVAVVSDHGMESLERIFFINEWLERKGYLTFQENPDPVDEDELPSEKEYVFGQVDWETTQAYSIGKAGEIRLNLEGREPTGCVSPEDYDEVREAIMGDLRDAKDPRTGAKLTESVTTREKLLDGENVDSAPDIFVTIADGCYSLGYLYNAEVMMVNDEPEAPFVTGIEDGPGIICQSGPVFCTEDESINMGLVDYLPTLLHAMGLEVPANMDGEVKTDILSDERMGGTQVSFRRGQAGEMAEQGEREGTSEEVKDRLEDLGYF